ncbi:MAG: hypothetical protein U0412_03820 [Nitrospira sp.]
MSIVTRVAARLLVCFLTVYSGAAQAKSEKAFNAIVTDSKGVQTDIANVIFYWEEKVSETSFVPHEMREMPLKRGVATVKIKFEQIKQMVIKSGGHDTTPEVSITLTDGKTGDFALGIPGIFKGRSEFGDVELPAGELKQVVFQN